MGTHVRLPPTLLYPVEVIRIDVKIGDPVSRQQLLLKFKYWNRVPDGVAEEGEVDPPLVTREFYGEFESPYDGTVSELNVKVGDLINDELAAVCTISEGCDHSVQYGGLCALCGRSLDQKDYLGYADEDRAPIAMSHDTSGLTVSRQEAERIETRQTQQLLRDRRLVLVVDLDQTVIHASVSQEIAQWIADPENPHHELMKDVHSFSLRERPAAPNANPQDGLSWYYLKLRPGLQEFLEAMHPLYEMHVYTMATKQYALEVTKVIDPTGRFFADRVLSRDASGSLLQKDLKRLFPVSTNMVTIIDDRGDVWSWSPHLVRVVPYHFWSNTGDINSQFLPKRAGLVTPQSEEEEKTDEETKREDHELDNIGRVLTKLHTRFYEDLDKKEPVKLEKLDDQQLPNVGKLLPQLKEKVFDGCVILFSGFFPVGMSDLYNADIVQWVWSFGAVVVANYLPVVTHVVAKSAGTVKARQAAGHKKHVVSIDWVFKCLEEWKHVDEKQFTLEVPNPITVDEVEKVEEESAEVDTNIANGFVRSLQRGDVDWDEMDEELKELLKDDESDEEEKEDKEKDQEKEREDRKRKREESDLEDLEEDWD